MIPTQVTVSRKIIDSTLKETIEELFLKEESDMVEQPLISAMGMLSNLLNDVPQQIPKLIEKGVLKAAVATLDKGRIPCHNDYFLVSMRLLNAIIVQQDGEALISNS